MNWTGLKTYYGFGKPYDFHVAIPALLNAGFLLLIIVKFASALHNNNKARIYGPIERNFLNFPSEMFYFYLYILIGLVFLNLFIRKKKLYWPLFVWFLLEFSLGAWGKGLSPFDARTAFDDRFQYHPLLQATLVPNFKGRNDGLFVAHNSAGLRDTNNSLDRLKRNGLIYVFGGSSTYDFAVSQGETWVEKLNGLLGPPYTLFNFGVPGYSTSEHVIQTAFYGDINGAYPSCALYYIGWNDVRNAGITDLDRGYADWHLLNLSRNLKTRRSMNIMTISPALKLVLREIGYLVDTVPYPNPQFDPAAAGRDYANLKSLFTRNVATIAAINSSRNVKTIVVGQMLNRDQLANAKDNPKRHEWMPFLLQKDLWSLQAEFNDLLRTEAAKAGYSYIDADIDKFDSSDFADSGHFTAPGAEKFAFRIAEEVRRACPAS
jgi:hypothetical protein